MRTMALYMAGTILSQLPMPIQASHGCAPMMVSIWSAISSREGSEYFMPKWPMAMPSQTAPPTLVYQTLKPSDFQLLAQHRAEPVQMRMAGNLGGVGIHDGDERLRRGRRASG